MHKPKMSVDGELPSCSHNCNHANKTLDEFVNKFSESDSEQEEDSFESTTLPIKLEDITNDLKQQLQISKESETKPIDMTKVKITYTSFQHETQLMEIMKLIEAELSEPYSIYTYRYFIYNWPHLCLLAEHEKRVIGAIVCKQEEHHGIQRGYIAMLAVHKSYRKHRIGTTLVEKAIDVMVANNADEVVLETEMTNVAALSLYENLGFVRSKRLYRYYLNGVDAFCLKLWLK